MKLLTFAFDSSPAHLEVLSTNSLYDLVDVAFDVCCPRGDDEARDHTWNIQVLGGSLSEVYEFNMFVDELIPDSGRLAQTTKLCNLKLQKGVKLMLEYDTGSTTEHFFELLSVQPVKGTAKVGEFPRRKLEAPAPKVAFSTSAVNLDENYPSLNKWIFISGQLKELNLFQAGRTHHYGYLERRVPGTGQMMYLPDKAESLNHYMKSLNEGAQVRSGGMYNWHSIVVLPPGSKKLSTYNDDLEPGFCDCKVVGPATNDDTDLSKVFPKTAALGGFRADKVVKKGWIRYKDETLLIVSGSGGTSSRPHAPKGTAYDGAGFHAGGFDNVLFRVQKDFGSLHELFCEVEGLLSTL